MEYILSKTAPRRSEGSEGDDKYPRSDANAIAEIFEDLDVHITEHIWEDAAQGAPGTREAKDITLVEPDDMINWLTDLNSNWAVLRNTRSFMEGQPKEYWKKFDACMGKAFELQIALMKLRAAQPGAPTKKG
jgi:hypothetical protein